MPIFSQSSLRQTLGKGLGSGINKSLQSATGAKNTSEARGQLMKSLAGKSDKQRESVYKSFGIGQTGRKQIEGTIGEGKKSYTKNELVKIRRAEESKKKLNIFLSKRSADQGGSGYATSSSSFAGGAVETKSRVGAIDKGKEERGTALGMGQKKIGGFALGSASSSGGGFALGQAKGTNKGFALNGSGDKKDESKDDIPKRPGNLSFGGGM
jgi:hypothetical protein